MTWLLVSLLVAAVGDDLRLRLTKRKAARPRLGPHGPVTCYLCAGPVLRLYPMEGQPAICGPCLIERCGWTADNVRNAVLACYPEAP